MSSAVIHDGCNLIYKSTNKTSNVLVRIFNVGSNNPRKKRSLYIHPDKGSDVFSGK